MIIKTNVWGLWSPEIGGLGWVHGTIGLSLGDAKSLLSDRKANRDAWPNEFVREVELSVSVSDDGRVKGFAQASGLAQVV